MILFFFKLKFILKLTSFVDDLVVDDLKLQ